MNPSQDSTWSGTNWRRALRLAAMGAWVALAANLVRAQSEGPAEVTPGADWPSFNRDLASTRYSPLTDINTDNVKELTLAWRYPLGRNVTTGTLSGGSEFTPLVIAGVMYVAAADHVSALRADTGEELWRYNMEPGNEPPSRRGLAYWPGDAEHAARIYFTAGSKLIGLSPKAGERVIRALPVRYAGAPIVYKDLVIVGSNSPPGSVRAFDARSGDQVWAFESVPGPGEFGHDSWQNDSWRNHPSLLHWAFAVTVDSATDTVYAVFESPGPDDYYGGNRPGDTLFGDSLVAIDAATGKRRWHFQAIHHDIWDYDLPAPPSLLDVSINGRSVPILALIGKAGYMYLLNRTTGKPVFGIKEQAVPASHVPGEQSAPTQPIPVKPPALARTSFGPADVVDAEDTNEQHARLCRDFYERNGGFENSGPFTPYQYRATSTNAPASIIFPGDLGGANWGGTAADPTSGYVFVNTTDQGSIGWIEPRATPQQIAGVLLGYQKNSIAGPLSWFWSNLRPNPSGNALSGGETDWPCQKPPWGSLLAVNAATGDIAWRVPLGITAELPPEKQHTGRLNLGGPIVTAGGLVFIGASNDRRFRAFDAKTGTELWSTVLPMSAHATPITYRGLDGKQYVAIVAAGASSIDSPSPNDAQSLLVYTLP